MGRGKLDIELIKKDRSRFTTFKKRKNGLKKKIEELSTLCGVKVAVILYAPQDYPNQLLQPDVWPSDRTDVIELINKYKAQSPGDHQKMTVGLADYFENRKRKIQNQLENLHKIDKAKYPTWDTRYDDFSEEQVGQIRNFFEKKIEYAKARFEMLKNVKNCSRQQSGYSCMQQQSLLPTQGNNFLLPLDQYHAFNEPYNYQLPQQQQGFSSNFDNYMDLIPNQGMMNLVYNNDEYDCGPSRSRDVVYDPFKAEPVFYDDLMLPGMVDVGCQVPYYGEPILPMPQYNMDLWSTRYIMQEAASFQEEDHENYENRDYGMQTGNDFK